MLHTIKGDLLKSDCQVIAHQANCQKTMGSGVARQIKAKYPEAYQADLDLTLGSNERFGSFSDALAPNGVRIFNLYGQFDYRGHKTGFKEQTVFTKVPQLYSAACGMMEKLDELGYPKDTKIGVPYKIGCDRGGGDWYEVQKMLDRVSDLYDRDIYLYWYKG